MARFLVGPGLVPLVSLCSLLAGCSAIGLAAYKVAGPPEVPAKYVPVKEPLLVVVENYRQPSGWQADADLLARYVERELETSGVAPVVDSNKLREMRLSQP